MALIYILALIGIVFAPPLYLAYFLIRKRVHLSTLLIVFLVLSVALGLNLRHVREGSIGWPLDASDNDNTTIHVFALVFNSSVIAAPLLLVAEYLEHRNKRRRSNTLPPNESKPND